MLRVANKVTPLGAKGTVGSGVPGRKPREQRKRHLYGVPTQGQCSGHEFCNKGKCDHPRQTAQQLR